MKLTADEAIVRLEVPGRPAPQGSKKGFARGGKVAMVEMSRHVKPWREDVRTAAEKWIADHPGLYPIQGALSVDMVFSIARPKGHFGTGRNAGVLKPSAPAYPTGAPDLSKLARSTEDAITSAGLWSDDSRVVHYGRLEKQYVIGPDDASPLFDPYVMRVPGAVIVIRTLEVAW